MKLKRTLLSMILGATITIQGYTMDAPEEPREEPISPMKATTVFLGVAQKRKDSTLSRLSHDMRNYIAHWIVTQGVIIPYINRFRNGTLTIERLDETFCQVTIDELGNPNGDDLSLSEPLFPSRVWFHTGFPLNDQSEGDKDIHIYIIDKYTGLRNPNLAEFHPLLKSPHVIGEYLEKFYDQTDVLLLFRMGDWPLRKFDYYLSSFSHLNGKEICYLYTEGRTSTRRTQHYEWDPEMTLEQAKPKWLFAFPSNPYVLSPSPSGWKFKLHF